MLAPRLALMEQHAKDLLHAADDLRTLTSGSNPGQRETASFVRPLLQSLASQLDAMSNCFDGGDIPVCRHPTADYLHDLSELAGRTASLIHDLVEWGGDHAETGGQHRQLTPTSPPRI
jgi:hypothetical protein